MPEKEKQPPQQKPITYTIRDVMAITDELFKLQKEKQYHLGPFVHGLIFALEVAQQSYQIPPQQLAEIKRDCRRTVQELSAIEKQKGTPPLTTK